MVDNDDSTDGDTREQGIEFGELKRQLESHEYPATGEELLEAYGEAKLGLPEGSETLRDILGKRHNEQHDADAVRYESPQEVHQAIFNMVGSDAIGREHYTDRGSSHLNEIDDEENRDKQTL